LCYIIKIQEAIRDRRSGMYPTIENFEVCKCAYQENHGWMIRADFGDGIESEEVAIRRGLYPTKKAALLALANLNAQRAERKALGV
jgi:hypothetical protein